MGRNPWALGARADRVRLTGADDVLDERVPGDPVAQILIAVEARAIDWDHRHTPALRGRPRHAGDIVTMQRWHTGRIDEDRSGAIPRDRLAHRGQQSLLAPAHDHIQFGQVSGHADPVQVGTAGAAAATVPGRARATDGPVNDVRAVRDGHQRITRAIEGAAPLSRAGRCPGTTRFSFFVMGTGQFVL